MNLTATENDNDTKAITLTPSTGVTVTEGSTASYKVKLATKPSGNVTVTVARKSGNDQDSDISVKTGASLTFTTANWNTDRTVTLEAAQDIDGENGTATIQHSASGGGYDNVAADLTATESDDDGKAIALSSPSGVTVGEGSTVDYEVKLATKPSGNVTVSVARSTSGTQDGDIGVKTGTSLTFTTTNWNTDQTVTLEAAQDNDGDNGTATIVHTASGGGYDNVAASLTATESDDDTKAIALSSPSGVTVGEGSTASYEVRLATKPSGNVTVGVARSTSGTQDGDIGVKTGASLTFTTTNWNTDRTVTLEAAQDNDGENGTATIVHTASGGGYDNVTANLTATESDDDAVGITLSTASVTVGEGAEASYRVRLATEPTASVSVSVSRTSGDQDISVKSGASLTFTADNWNTDQTVTLQADQDNDGLNGRAVFTHTAAPAAATARATATLTATEQDADDGGEFTVSPTTLALAEGGEGAYSVSLSAEPTSDVTVTVQSADQSSVTVDPSQLTFTPANYTSAQTVTVTAVDDPDQDSETVGISNAATGGGYAHAATVVVTVTDDDLQSEEIGGAPSGPSAVGSIPDVTVEEGAVHSFDVASYFSSDAEEFAAQSADDGVASADMSGTRVQVTGKVAGTTTVTVTASNAAGSTDQTFQVTVEAAPVTIVQPPAERVVTIEADPPGGGDGGGDGGNGGGDGGGDGQPGGGANEEVDLDEVFQGGSEDSVTYEAVSSAPGIASVTIVGNRVVITPRSPGTATITVTATGSANTVRTSFRVTVLDAVPVVAEQLPDVSLTLGGESLAIDATPAFGGTSLIWRAAAEETAIASVEVDGPSLTLVPVSVGATEVTVTVSNSRGSARQTFRVTVRDQAPGVLAPLPDVVLTLGKSDAIDLGAFFGGTNLLWEAAPDDPAIGRPRLRRTGVDSRSPHSGGRDRRRHGQQRAGFGGTDLPGHGARRSARRAGAAARPRADARRIGRDRPRTFLRRHEPGPGSGAGRPGDRGNHA